MNIESPLLNFAQKLNLRTSSIVLLVKARLLVNMWNSWNFTLKVEPLIPSLASGLDKLLLVSIHRSDIEAAKILLHLGADPEAEDGLPIIRAAASNNLDMVKLILATGASVKARDNCALNWSIYNKNLEIEQLLQSRY